MRSKNGKGEEKKHSTGKEQADSQSNNPINGDWYEADYERLFYALRLGGGTV